MWGAIIYKFLTFSPYLVCDKISHFMKVTGDIYLLLRTKILKKS